MTRPTITMKPTSTQLRLLLVGFVYGWCVSELRNRLFATSNDDQVPTVRSTPTFREEYSQSTHLTKNFSEATTTMTTPSPSIRTIAAVSVYHPNWPRPPNLPIGEAGKLGLGISQGGPIRWESPKSRVLDNTGNLAWGWAVHQLLDNRNYDLVYDRATILNNSSASIQALLMGTGPMLASTGKNESMVKSRFKYMTNIVNSVRGPQLIVGMGPLSASNRCDQGLAPESRALVQLLHDVLERYGGYVTLRGQCTQDMIASAGVPTRHFPVMGCPTYFLNREPELGRRLEEKYKKVVATIENSGRSSEHNCLKLGILTSGTSVLDGMMQFVGDFSCSEGSMHLMQQGGDQSLLKKIQEKAGNNIYIKGEQFYDFHTWKASIQDLDLVIGPRIHGCMVPISAEVPTVTFKKDNRIGELCEAMDLACAPTVSKEQFQDAIMSAMKGFDGAKFDANRKAKAGRYAELFQEMGLALHQDVAALA